MSRIPSTRASGSTSAKSLALAFLKPGWVITAVAVIAFAYLAFTVLAPWQLGKNEKTSARNHQVSAAFDADPVAYSSVFTQGSIPADKEWTRVTLTGHYLNNQAVLRMRPVNSEPAYQFLTPFETTTGEIFLVNRGFESAGDSPSANTPPSAVTTITGYARLDEDPPANAPLTNVDPVQVSGINTEQIGRELGVHLAHDWIQLAEAQPGAVTAIPLPKLDSGPYLSYGVQWIAFGIMAPLGLAYFVWAEIKERRREDRDRTQLSAPSTASSESSEEPTDASVEHNAAQPASIPTTPARRQRSRYGGTRSDHWGKLAEKNEERF